MSHTETQWWDAAHGVLTALVGPNGLESAWSYDNFGRRLAEVLPQTAPNTTFTYEECDSVGGAAKCAYAIRAVRSDGSYTLTEFDSLMRERHTVTSGFDQDVETFRDFDVLGREYRVSLPEFAASISTCWELR